MGSSVMVLRTEKAASLQTIDNRGSWTNIIREPYSGAWQRNDEWRVDTVQAYWALYACLTLISQDIGKLRPCLMQAMPDGTSIETTNPAYSPYINNPNHYQNHIQFKQWWTTSLLSRGNTYVLKRRDERGVVNGLYILDPLKTMPMVSTSGDVFYACGDDILNNLSQSLIIPASEIIHDRINPLFHPLCGISPIFASGLAAQQGLNMQKDSSWFFANAARPGGVLSAPGPISDENAERLKAAWNENYTGKNAGRVAVVGDGLKFETMRMTNVDAQLIEQFELTATVICATFHVPPFKIGMGQPPAGQKISDLNQIYYSDCLQSLIESMELLMDEGLRLPSNLSYELDLDGLLRMDTTSLYTSLALGVKGSLLTPNEARKRINAKPLKGGDTVYMQQQNFSLAALDRRDALENPFATGAAAPASGASNQQSQDDDEEKLRKMQEEWFTSSFGALAAELLNDE